jgi:hypothetical protein
LSKALISTYTKGERIVRISRVIMVRSALAVLAVGGLLSTTACGSATSDKHSSSTPAATPTPNANDVVLKNNIDPCTLVSGRVLRANNNGKDVSVKHRKAATSRNDLYRRSCEFTNGLIVSTLREPKGSKLVYTEYDLWHSGEGIDFVMIDNNTLKQFPGTDDGEWITDSHKPVSLQVHTKGGVTLYFTSTQSNKPAVVQQQFTAYAQSALKNPVITKFNPQ